MTPETKIPVSFSDRFTALIENAFDAISLVDAAGQVVFVGPNNPQLLGYNNEEALGKTLFSDLHPEDVSLVQEEWRKVLQAPGATVQLECRVCHKDGSWRWIEVRGRNLCDHPAIQAIVVNWRDISERKYAEQELRQSETCLTLALDAAQAGVWSWDITSNVSKWDQRSIEAYGFSPGHSPSFETWLAAVHPEDRERLQTRYQALVEPFSGDLWNEQFRINHPVAGECWMVGLGRIDRDQAGRPLRFVGISFDITERKRDEKQIREQNASLERRVQERTWELEESRTFLQSVLDSLSAHIAVIDQTGVIIAVNAAWRTFANENGGADALGTNYLKISEKAGGIGAVAAKGIREVIDHLRDSFYLEYDCHGPKEQRWFGMRVTRLSDDVSSHVVVAHENITERKQAEAELQLSEAKYHALFDNAVEGLFQTTSQGAFLNLNPALARIYGYSSPAEVIAHFEDIGAQLYVHPKHRQEFIRLMDAHKYVTAFESEVFRKDGSRAWISESARSVFDADGQLLWYEGTVEDITERKHTEQALENERSQLEQRVLDRTQQLLLAKEDADRANRAKSDFLSRMSHELRTPLTSIIGFANLLAKSALPPRDQKRVGQVVKAGQHLLYLVNEVLDIARIEADSLHISQEPVNVHIALLEAVELVLPLAQGLEISLGIVPVSQEWYVLADNQRLKQVLLNLISNAVKYNREGGRVTVSCTDSSPTRLRLTVTDTGPGIPPEQIDGLFEPFNRLGAEKTAIEGTGLGLALAKRLTEAMHGALDVTSEVGRGSTFSVELPRGEMPQYLSRDVVARIETATRPITILYIENNPDSISLVEDILTEYPDFRLLTAMQGRLGLDMARAQRPDLILLDVNLPDILGDEVMGRVQSDPELSAIPVVIISAETTPGRIGQLRALGVRDYLTKPLDIPGFLAVLNQILGKDKSQHAT